MTDLWFILTSALVMAAFLLGHWKGMEDMEHIDKKYPPHTKDENCWCRSPVPHLCHGSVPAGGTDA